LIGQCFVILFVHHSPPKLRSQFLDMLTLWLMQHHLARVCEHFTAKFFILFFSLFHSSKPTFESVGYSLLCMAYMTLWQLYEESLQTFKNLLLCCLHVYIILFHNTDLMTYAHVWRFIMNKYFKADLFIENHTRSHLGEYISLHNLFSKNLIYYWYH